MDNFLTFDLDTAIPGQSELGSNGNEWVLHITQICIIVASPSDSVLGIPFFGGGGEDTVSIFIRSTDRADIRTNLNWYFYKEFLQLMFGFGLISLFNDISIFVGYLMPKPFL